MTNASYDPATGQVTFRPGHFSRFVVAYADVGFNDLQTAPWAETYIRALAAKEIVQGSGDGSFQPDRTVTRAEFVQMLMKGLGLIDGSAASTLSDVKEGAWYYAAAASAQTLGIVQGRSGGKFDAAAPITREEMAVLAYRAAQKAGALASTDGAASQIGSFIDQASISSFAVQAIAVMRQAGVIDGMSDGRFQPKSTATRAESAAIIQRLLFLPQ
ncbi:S-layer homology domain-containing protein [Cohnella rhizosphaerae]|uniref:S-layer homology domain-containing protein n=1 Tax=Cohnella rhizosphaerae TaxID=1457232 RepID=A0A9X4KT52_9BACL|nr:S-layer homology domain-containing protein [Cohnella rhizosphaerae]MDG0810636.1 S-layer homology domain-containing protein [Cohnella rhizosphaerae]